MRFPDHHAYSAGDWERAAELARERGAAYIVTTLKDAAKVTFEVPWPTLALRSELELLSGEDCVVAIVTQLTQRVASE
jgi:tetraacyldisaccharide-1-P 4'-kinase